MLLRREWIDRILDLYGDSVEVLGHFTDRLQRLSRQVAEHQRPRLERLREDTRELLAPHRWDKEGHGKPALRALHHEIALLEAGVVARRFRHLVRAGSFEAAGECLLEIEETLHGAAQVLGEGHLEVRYGRNEMRKILDQTLNEARAMRDGAAWIVECLERFREEGVTAEWPPYPESEGDLVTTLEDVDGM